MEGVARQCAGNSRSVQLQSQIDCEREVDPGSRGNIPVESDRIQARGGDGKSLLPAVWVMLVPTVVEFWSNNRAVLLVPGAEGVE